MGTNSNVVVLQDLPAKAKPCPHCGAEARSLADISTDLSIMCATAAEGYMVTCKCGGGSARIFPTLVALLRWWNWRDGKHPEKDSAYHVPVITVTHLPTQLDEVKQAENGEVVSGEELAGTVLQEAADAGEVHPDLAP